MLAIAELSVANWHRLNRLLETALALEAEARNAWLQSLPADEAICGRCWSSCCRRRI